VALCCCKHLVWALSNSRVTSNRSNRVLFEVGICSLVSIPLGSYSGQPAYIKLNTSPGYWVSPYRYIIFEDTVFYPSALAVALMFSPHVVLCTACIMYACKSFPEIDRFVTDTLHPRHGHPFSHSATVFARSSVISRKYDGDCSREILPARHPSLLAMAARPQ